MKKYLSYIPSRMLTFIGLAALVTACASPPASPKLMEECTRLDGLWIRYQQDRIFNHTGEQAQAEIALGDCIQGNYEAGITKLKQLLARGHWHFAN